MDLNESSKKFYQRWGIKEEESKDGFYAFRKAILRNLSGIDDAITSHGHEIFCLKFGINPKYKRNRKDIYEDDPCVTIISYLVLTGTPEKFYHLLQIIFDLPFRDQINKQIFLAKIDQVLEYSNVPLSLSYDESFNVTFYPKGEELLDEELVNHVLSFSSDSEDSHFKDALKFCEGKNSIKSAESLRRCVEEYLRSYFDNIKGLKSNLGVLKEFLKERNEKALITTSIHQIFSSLDTYFNDQSKHQDGDIDEAENEYLIYQVALLLRYLEKIKNN